MPTTPPWEVPGYDDCVRDHPNGQACLLATRPRKCITPAWEKLQRYGIDKCPPNFIDEPIRYDMIPGHEDCIRPLPKEDVWPPVCLHATNPPKCIP